MSSCQQEFEGPGSDSFGVTVVHGGLRPLIVEVLAPSLVGAGLPRVVGSARTQPSAAPGDVGSEDAFKLLRLLDRLREQFDTRIVIHLIEPLSFVWIVRILRHRTSRYPMFVVGGRAVIAGLDEHALTHAIAAHLQ
jgi:hypothetical protein